MRTIKFLFFGYLSLILLAVIGYLAARSFSPPRDPNTFFSVYIVNIRSLEAAKIADVTSADITGHIYETLYNYRYGGKPDELFPQIAADFPTISSDGLTYTFPIRRGIRFYDAKKIVWKGGIGPEITARDVVFSWKRFADFQIAAGAYSTFLQDNIVGLDDFRTYTEHAPAGKVDYDRPVEGLVAVDDRTLRVKLIRPIPNFLQLIAVVPLGVISRESIEKLGTLREHPIGSGPYALTEYKQSQRIVLTANPIYRGRPDIDGDQAASVPEADRLPKIKGIQLDFAQEMLPIWHWFMRGRYDQVIIPKETFGSAVTNDKEIDPALAKRGINLRKQSDLGVWFMQLNMTDPIIGKNKALREAMSLAIDREKFIRVYRNGRGVIATSILPPDAPLYDPNYRAPWLKFDREAAKAKLKEAEAFHGGPLPTLKLDSGNTNTEARQYAEFFIQQWAQIGLKVEPSYNTYARFLEKMDTKDYQINYTGWVPDYPDEKTYLRLFDATLAKPPGSNTTGYNDPVYQTALERSLVLPRSPERDALYLQMRNILDEELPVIPIYYGQLFALQYQWLDNVKTPFFNMGFWAYQTLDVARRQQSVNER